jgi:hypothetical protein
MARNCSSWRALRNDPVELRSVFVPQAMDDLAQGRAADHHRRIAEPRVRWRTCDAVMLRAVLHGRRRPHGAGAMHLRHPEQPRLRGARASAKNRPCLNPACPPARICRFLTTALERLGMPADGCRAPSRSS